jgi:hypothetical protein
MGNEVILLRGFDQNRKLKSAIREGHHSAGSGTEVSVAKAVLTSVTLARLLPDDPRKSHGPHGAELQYVA